MTAIEKAAVQKKLINGWSRPIVVIDLITMIACFPGEYFAKNVGEP
jgi:hypothetical protein